MRWFPKGMLQKEISNLQARLQGSQAEARAYHGAYAIEQTLNESLKAENARLKIELSLAKSKLVARNKAW